MVERRRSRLRGANNKMTEQKIVEMWRAYYGEGDKKLWRVVELNKEGRILSTRMFHKKKHAKACMERICDRY